MKKQTQKTNQVQKSAKKHNKLHLDLGNPVTVMANQIASLFEKLKDVSVAFDYGAKKIRLYVTDVQKADALNLIMKHHHDIGNLYLNVEIVEATANDTTVLTPPSWKIKIPIKGKHEAFGKAFGPWVKSTILTTPDKQKWYFCEFAPAVLSWQADDIRNPKGFQSCTVEDIVKLACDTDGIQISTLPR